MCETRNEMRQQREEHASEQDDRQRSHNRYGGGPHENVLVGVVVDEDTVTIDEDGDDRRRGS